MPFSSKSFVRATLLLLGVGFLTVLSIVATAVWLAGRNDRFADELVDALTIRREAFAVLVTVQNAETGQRGYLLTQQEVYLEPFRAAAAEIDSELARLREIARNWPRYTSDIEMLAARLADKFSELGETIDLVKAGQLDRALALVRTDRGRVSMGAVRANVESLVRSTDALVATNTGELKSSARLLVWLLVAGGFVILCVVGGTVWVAWRHLRDLEMARAEVLALNATLEARVRERTADVARANEEIQRFAYIVSHDLRSPLVNIMGFTRELEGGVASMRALLDSVESAGSEPAAAARAAVEREMPEALEFIRSSTTRMDGLIGAILKLSREGRRQLSPEHVRMSDVLSAAKASIRHRLDETGAEMEIAAPIPDIVTDRMSVEQIFGNLVDNAVKYLDPGRPGRIVARARETPMGIEYDVEDNGRGIASNDRERIFDLFRRAGAPDRPGEGIGLSHVRALVRRLGGTILLRSEVGAGTTFTVRLPRILSPSAESEET